MNLPRLRIAAYGLSALALAALLVWLFLPRLIGLAAERWLNIPGLETIHVDIASVNSGQAHLREVRGVYHSAAGDRFEFVLRNIDANYSLARRHIERLEIAQGELVILPGQTRPASAWPQLTWSDLPFSLAQVTNLQVAVRWPQRPPLEASGLLLVQQDAGTVKAELRAPSDVIRVTATPGAAVEILAEWLPQNGPAATARLRIGRNPAQQPATLDAHAPLSMLQKLASALDVSTPLGAWNGAMTLQAEAILGDTGASVRSVTGKATFTAAELQTNKTPKPAALAVDGAVRYAWHPPAAQITLQPGLRWQAMAGGEPLSAKGQIDREFVIRIDDRLAHSTGEFPFVLQSPRWGEWNGAVQSLRLRAGASLGDWTEADMQLRITGQREKWQQAAFQARNLRATGDATLHWSRTGGLRGTLDMQAGTGRLSWSGESPLVAAQSLWSVKAEATAKPDGNWWQNLVLRGQASSQPLKIQTKTGQTLTIGPTRLNVQPSYPARMQGEMLLTTDTLRFGNWPAPAVQARLQLRDNILHADGWLGLQGAETLRFSGSHALARTCGNAAFSLQQSLPALEKQLQPRPPALLPLNLQDGSVEARLALDWCLQPKLTFNAKGTARARDTTAGWDKARVEAAQVNLQLDSLQPLQGRLQVTAPRGQLAAGASLADLNIDLAIAPHEMTVHALDVKLLGGRLSGGPSRLPWPPQQQSLPLHVHQVDLGQLLKLFDLEGLSGSGQLDGVLPLAWRNGGLEIRDGRLASSGSGTLKYASAQPAHDNIGLQALRNFHYKQLKADISYTSDGDYRARATLQGNNPDFYDGYPVHLRLNIGGNLPGMFRAALFSGDFSRHILQQLQTGKLQ